MPQLSAGEFQGGLARRFAAIAAPVRVLPVDLQQLRLHGRTGSHQGLAGAGWQGRGNAVEHFRIRHCNSP
jgi:hypothetical protein